MGYLFKKDYVTWNDEVFLAIHQEKLNKLKGNTSVITMTPASI